MTAPENPDQLPERLIAFRPKRSPLALAPHGPMFAAEEQRPGDLPTCAEEQAYVREDVADAAVDAALVAMLEELRKRGWECPDGMDGDDHAICASRVRQALTAK